MEIMHTSEVGKAVGQSVLSHHEVLYGACEKCAICMWISPRKTHCGCAIALIVLWFSNISCFWCVHGDVLQTHRMSRRSLLCDYWNRAGNDRTLRQSCGHQCNDSVEIHCFSEKERFMPAVILWINCGCIQVESTTSWQGYRKFLKPLTWVVQSCPHTPW